MKLSVCPTFIISGQKVRLFKVESVHLHYQELAACFSLVELKMSTDLIMTSGLRSMKLLKARMDEAREKCDYLKSFVFQVQ